MGHFDNRLPSFDGGLHEEKRDGNECESLEEVRITHEKEARAEDPSIKITCGAPRWFVLVTYSIYAFFTGAAYFNWTPMADMLYGDGAYEWLCTQEEINTFLGSSSHVDYTRPRCKEQELAVGRVFSAMSASEFGFAAFAGLLLDIFGPKLTAMIGTFMALCGWVLLGIGNKENRNTFIIIASVLLGGSSETCFYPLLPAAHLYPGKESTIVAIFGTFRSISLLIPLVMRSININANIMTFQSIVMSFGFICIASCFVFAFVFIPKNNFPKHPYTNTTTTTTTNTNTTNTNTNTNTNNTNNMNTNNTLTNDDPDKILLNDGTDENGNKRMTTSIPIKETGIFTMKNRDNINNTPDNPLDEKSTCPISIRKNRNGMNTHEGERWEEKYKCEEKNRNKCIKSPRSEGLSCIREVFTWRYILMMIAYLCIILTIMFFVPSTSHLIPDAYVANQIIQIFSFLPCPVLGYFADKVGILWVMQFINSCGLFAYLAVIIPNLPNHPFMQFVAAILCSIEVSFMNSQLYCYGNRYLSQENYGKLIGTCFCLAGLMSLSTQSMRRYSLLYGFKPMCWLSVGLTLFVLVLLAVLQIMEYTHLLLPSGHR